jgi:hypothetical protein
MPRITLPTLLALLAAAPAAAQDPIATDRPDFVESSLTVGKHVFQYETSAATDWTTSAGVTARAIATPTLLRFGVSNTLELRFETDGLYHASVDGAGSETGMADAAFGIKWHALDGAAATPSLAFLLHGDVPTGSAAFRGIGVRPSLRAVGEWALPGEFALGVMPGVAYDPNGGVGQQWTAILGATVGRPVSEKLRFFVEYAAEQLPTSENGGTVALLDVGSAFLITSNIQLDLSYRHGLTSLSSAHSLALGFSQRFR